MIRLFTIFISTLCLISSASAANPVVIYVDDASAPFSSIAGGAVIGVYPAIYYAAFAKMKIPVKVVAMPRAQALAEASQGKGGVGDFYATPEKLAQYDVSEPVVAEKIAVYFNKTKSIDFKNTGDLYGKKVGTITNRNYSEYFATGRKNGGIKVIEAGTDKMNFQRLVSGSLDAVLTTEESGKATIYSEKLLGVEQGKNYLRSQSGLLAFAKSAKQTELLANFNKTIAAMKQDGSFDKIVKQEILK
jgi:polar amino acid transport system substrate-binding protein